MGNIFQKFQITIIIIIILSINILIMSSFAYSDQSIKNPNVSGQFYSGNSARLSADINKYLKEANIEPFDKHVDIVIAPHAGYIYSAGVAAYGFKAVSKNNYKTVVIVAPSHYLAFDGISIGTQKGFKTPLGVAEVDQEFVNSLISQNEKFYFEPQAFEREHSLEVEIPFVQTIFKDAKIVPIIIGQPSLESIQKLALSLDKIIGNRKDVLIVVSTDMSHYHRDSIAREMDRATLEALKNFDIEKFWKGCSLRKLEMCGYMPVTVALFYAKKRGLKNIQVLKYANSGDVTGDTSKVVGYSSLVIYGDNNGDNNIEKKENSKNDSVENNSSFTMEQKKRLIEIARKTIEEYVKTGKKYQPKVTDPRLLREEGAFVTINKNGQLRGCIGNIIGVGPLYLTVRNMAISAVSQDPRFSPVKESELKDIEIEISVLSKPWVIKDISEFKLGVHGAIVTRGIFNRGVFLPQVGDDPRWTKEAFFSELCYQKAHLPPDAWRDPKTKIEIFTAEVFSEHEVK